MLNTRSFNTPKIIHTVYYSNAEEIRFEAQSIFFILQLVVAQFDNYPVGFDRLVVVQLTCTQINIVHRKVPL